VKIGIITDIHEDVAGLEKALALLEKYQCDEIACLGDIVGYNPDYNPPLFNRSAQQCLHLVRSNCKWVVPGNHDLFASQQNFHKYNSSERTPCFLDVTPDVQPKPAKSWTYQGELDNDLNEESKEYLCRLPLALRPEIPGINCMFSHYIFPDLSGSKPAFIRKRSELMPVRDMMVSKGLSYLFTGHMHYPGAGFAFPERINGFKKQFKAIELTPFGRFTLNNSKTIVLLPALSALQFQGGISILDTDNLILNILPFHHKH